MKQDEIDMIMEKIDRKCKLPKHWDKFIEKQTESHNYIFKDTKNKTGYCTKCHKTFYEKQIKIGDSKVCPNCKNEFYVLNPNRYIKDFKQSVLLLQRMDKQIIIRVFEICTFYNTETKLMEQDIQEYCRIIPGKGRFFSEAVYFGLYSMYISHNSCNENWRPYNGTRYFSEFPAYPYNKKKLVKGTNLEYAPIKEFTQRFWRFNFIDTLEFAGYESFEILWNMKLYNLSMWSEKFQVKGSFYERFGITKNYLKFMQDNDLNYSELRILKLLKTQDINLIRRLSTQNYNDVRFLYKNKLLFEYLNRRRYLDYYEIRKLKEVQKFIPLHKLIDYKKGWNNLDIYTDYLKMANMLALNYKSKKDLFQRNLISRHDKMQMKIKVAEDIKTQFAVYLRYLELSKYMYENDKYIIFPAPSVDDFKDEGRQQGNCVATNYLTPYLQKETEIYFIRKLDNPDKSFITLEYKNGKIRQKELPHHSRKFTAEHEEFFNDWLIYRNFIDGKAKKQSKVTNIIEYKLEKLVA